MDFAILLVSFLLLYLVLVYFTLLYLVLVFLPNPITCVGSFLTPLPWVGFLHTPIPCAGLSTYCYTFHWSSFLFLSGAHLGGGGGGIHPLPSTRKVSLKRPFAPKMPNEGLK